VAEVAGFNEKRVPATLAVSFADCEWESHDRELGRPARRLLIFLDNFFLFSVMTTQLWRSTKDYADSERKHNKIRSPNGRGKILQTISK
jgi:hypothetical protein